MTLILTVATADKIVQVSDRLLTYPIGGVPPGDANKAVVVRCQDARFTIAYTGMGIIEKKRTDIWLAEYLNGIHAAHTDLNSICSAFIERLSTLSWQNQIYPLSLILAGYVSDRSFVALISNVEKWKTRESAAQTKFQLDALIEARYDPKQGPLFCFNGCEPAMTKSINFKLKHLRKKRFFQNNDADIVGLRLVHLIREASKTQGYGQYVGRDCMSVAISHDPEQDIICSYYPEKESSRTYTPFYISPRLSLMGIEMLGPCDRMEFRFFSRGQPPGGPGIVVQSMNHKAI
jgi:hypothetical protein